MKIKRVLTICSVIVTTFVLAHFVSFELNAQVESVFNGARFNDSLATVIQKVTDHAKSVKVVLVPTPAFPLAKDKEHHLICEDYQLKAGTIKEVAFTFADEKLTNIEARGNAVKHLVGNRKDKPMVYLGLDIYRSDLMVADKKEDAVWLLTKPAGHINLFTWSNPWLPSNKGKKTQYESSATVPGMMKMGGHIDELLPLFKKNSKKIYEMKLDGSDPDAQLQVDCFGIEYAGFPRKMEAQFGDNKLNIVWILTGKEEESRVRKALIKAYGKPVFINKKWEAFKGWQVLLRKDKPEILLVTKKLVEENKKEILGE